MTSSNWLYRRLDAMRGAASRGATLVEYSLVFALIAVVCLVAVELLNESASNEVNNQAECLSDRPPPEDECGFADVPSEISVPDPGFTPPVSTPPVEAARPVITTTAVAEWIDGTWTAAHTAQLMRPVMTDPPVPDQPVSGATVVVRIEIHLDGGDWQPFDTTSCVTQGDGTCELIYEAPPEVDGVQFDVINVASSPPPSSLPARILIWRGP